MNRRGRLRKIKSGSWLLCASTLLLACSGGGDPLRSTDPRRVLIIGWDGATFRMVDPLLAEGRLPRLAELIERGATVRLESTLVPVSSAAWVGAMTGKGPGATGVYGFFEPVHGSYDVRLISSRSNRASPVWRITSRRGLRTHVFGVPVTYPPEPLTGTMVAGMLSPFDAEYAYPAELTERLRETGFVPDLGVWRQQQELTIERVATQLALKTDILEALLNDPDWRLAVVVFKCLDVVSHRAYDGGTRGTVGAVYELLDESLGRLLDVAGVDTDVLVMSDHGFTRYPVGFNLHSWLIEAGFAVRRGARVDPPASTTPLEQLRAERYRRRLAELDLHRTRAFATVCEGHFGGIRLNLAGREPQGIVALEDAPRVLEQITDALLALRIGEDGPPLVRRAIRGAELYPGPYAALVVPDLLLEFDEKVLAAAVAGAGTYAVHRPPQPDHDRVGVLIAAGPQIVTRQERSAASVIDITPTALHLLGLPVYREMTGRVLSDLLQQPGELQTISEADDPSAREAPGDAAPPFMPHELDELEERLRALGYVD